MPKISCGWHCMSRKSFGKQKPPLNPRGATPKLEQSNVLNSDNIIIEDNNIKNNFKNGEIVQQTVYVSSAKECEMNPTLAYIKTQLSVDENGRTISVMALHDSG